MDNRCLSNGLNPNEDWQKLILILIAHKEPLSDGSNTYLIQSQI